MNNRRHLLSRALKGRAETFGVIGEYTRAITDFNVIATVSVVENNLIQRFGTIDIYIKQGEVTSALHVIKQAINTSESRNRPFERLKFLSKKVTALHRIGRLRQAMDLAHATLDALKKYRNNHRSNEDIAKQIMGLLATMGNIYFALDECAHALQYHTRAHTMCLALDDIQMNGVILSNMCLVYWKMKSYDKAIECGSKSLAIGKQIGDVRAVSISLNNIGLIYDEMGDYDSGLKYFEQALTHFQKVGDKYGIGITFFNIASYHKEISGNLQAAENFFERSYIIQKEIADSYGTVDNETMLAQIYHVAHKRKKFLSCMKSLDSSIKAIDGQEQKRNYMILDMTRALMKKDREKFSRLIKTFFSQFKSEKDVTEDILTFCALIDTVVAHQCTEGNNMIQKYIRVLETEAKSMQSPLHKAKIYRTLALWHASATNRKKSEEYLDALQNVTGQHGIHSLDTDINRLKKQLS